MLKEKLKKAVSIFQWLLTAVLVLVVLLLIFTAFNPVKSFQILRVMSGSMEPAIKVGSVVFIQKVKPEALKRGEIITYTSAEDPNISVTHRLVAIEEKEGKTIFKTKGDVNNTEDMTDVSSSQIKGRVIFSLPFLGYLSVWIKKPLGFGLLVILPAILIIISEILNIKKAIEKEVEKKYAKQEKQPKSKSISSLLIFFLLGIGLFQIKPTNAYFSDVVVIEGNTFSMASDWTTPPPPVAGNVVINEVMWMGSTQSSADKWIELRNTTNQNIDISNWRIEGAVLGSGGHLEIPAHHVVFAKGYFLISNYNEDNSNSALNVHPDLSATNINFNNNYNNNGALVLKDKNQVVIDSTPVPISVSWPAGGNGTEKQSMERNNTPGDGKLTGSWHTCEVTGCTSDTFWDTAGGNNYGTPKAANLSENDSTSLDYVVPTVTPTPTSTPAVTPELSSELLASSSVTIVEPTPTSSPTPETSPTPTPTAEPSSTPVPSTTPSPEPSLEVSPTPTLEPTSEPTPTLMPTPSPTGEP